MLHSFPCIVELPHQLTCPNPQLLPPISTCRDPAARKALLKQLPHSNAPAATLRAADPAARKAFLKELHELKTDIFNQLIETGALPVRPGVKRLISERPGLLVCGYAAACAPCPPSRFKCGRCCAVVLSCCLPKGCNFPTSWRVTWTAHVTFRCRRGD